MAARRIVGSTSKMPCKCHRSSLHVSLPNLTISNAGDLVAEYWAKNPKKKAAARKSLAKNSPKKPRKSVAADDSSDAGHTSTKKRGRKSSTKALAPHQINVTAAPHPPPPTTPSR